MEFPVNWLLKSVKSVNEIFLAIKYCFKTLEWQICSTNTISFSWENEAKLKTLKKLFQYIGCSFKFVLKTIKSLNQIFVDMEYWFKALECQIRLTNTILFFWETETNLATLQKLSRYIRVSHKVVLKSVKTLNRILWAMEYWFSLYNAKFARRIQSHFSRKTKQSLNLSKNFLRLLEFPISLF